MSAYPARSIQECNEIMTRSDMPWATEEREIKGRKLRVFKNQADSLRDFWDIAKTVGGDKEYIIYQGPDGTKERTTYAQAGVQVERVMNLLRSYGCKKGESCSLCRLRTELKSMVMS